MEDVGVALPILLLGAMRDRSCLLLPEFSGPLGGAMRL